MSIYMELIGIIILISLIVTGVTFIGMMLSMHIQERMIKFYLNNTQPMKKRSKK